MSSSCNKKISTMVVLMMRLAVGVVLLLVCHSHRALGFLHHHHHRKTPISSSIILLPARRTTSITSKTKNDDNDPPRQSPVGGGAEETVSQNEEDDTTADQSLQQRTTQQTSSFPDDVTDDDDGVDGGLRTGSTVIAKTSIPTLGIWQFQSYELQSIFDQGPAATTDGISIDRFTVNELSKPLTKPGYTRYITLYSSKYHQELGPITVTPEEVGLVSMTDEVIDSLLWALPLFGFWTALAISFANLYNDRYGGNWIDALFRT